MKNAAPNDTRFRPQGLERQASSECQSLVGQPTCKPTGFSRGYLTQDNSQIHIPDIPENVEAYENAKVARFKKKRMLSAGVDKPARRVASLEQGDRSDTPTPPPEFVANENPEKVEQNDATGDAQKAE